MTLAALVPCAQKPTEIHPDQLTSAIRDAFDKLMNHADQAAQSHQLDFAAHLHRQAADLIGIQLPASGELAVCDCQDCYCGRIVDAAKLRSYLDGTVWFTQCEHCTDDHPRTGDE